MQIFLCRWQATVALALGLLAHGQAAAQSAVAGQVGVSVDRGPVATALAPDWLVWRVFHDSLDFYDQQSPAVVLDLLKERLDLSEAERSEFMTIGYSYLRQLDRIDEEARAEIVARYKTDTTPAILPPSVARPEEVLRAGAGQIARTFVVGQTPDGHSIRDLLVTDGLVARIEARRQATLRLHLDTVRRAFGSDRLSKIETWVLSEVAPNVVFIPTGAGPQPRVGGLTPPSAVPQR